MNEVQALDHGFKIECANGFKISILLNPTQNALKLNITHQDSTLVEKVFQKIPKQIIEKITVNKYDYQDLVDFISNQPSPKLYVN